MDELTMNDIYDRIRKSLSNPELFKDNKLYFPEEKPEYRVKMPSQKQLAEANAKKRCEIVKMYQLGKEHGYMSEEDLREILKKEGKDVEALEKEISEKVNECIQIHITASSKKDSEEKILKELEEKRDKIEIEIEKLSNKKADLLSPAIEKQAEVVWYKYLTAVCTEKQIQDKWAKVWERIEDYENDESTLPYLAEAHMAMLIQNV